MNLKCKSGQQTNANTYISLKINITMINQTTKLIRIYNFRNSIEYDYDDKKSILSKISIAYMCKFNFSFEIIKIQFYYLLIGFSINLPHIHPYSNWFHTENDGKDIFKSMRIIGAEFAVI